MFNVSSYSTAGFLLAKEFNLGMCVPNTDFPSSYSPRQVINIKITVQRNHVNPVTNGPQKSGRINRVVVLVVL